MPLGKSSKEYRKYVVFNKVVGIIMLFGLLFLLYFGFKLLFSLEFLQNPDVVETVEPSQRR